MTVHLSANDRQDSLKRSTAICFQVYNQYRDISKAYVCDYYVKNHWMKLPGSWKEYLEGRTVDEIASLLDTSASTNHSGCPLSILCLKQIIRSYTVPRQKVENGEKFFSKEFRKYLWKNVKLKKRHEICSMSSSCNQNALKTDCFYIVDVGAGLGHLSRLLAYGFGFKVCTFEANSTLTDTAQKFDKQFEAMLKLKQIPHEKSHDIVHISKRIENDMSITEFISLVKKAFATNCPRFKFGIVGLHPCGNLASTLLRLYRESANIVFLNIVGCCYMKLSLAPDTFRGFPLSTFCRMKDINLDYTSCETACHAIENYIEKIRQGDQSLRVHSFRAALEVLMVKTDLKLAHSQTANVKYHKDMCFDEYCKKGLRDVYQKINKGDIESYQSIVNDTWTKVVIFYSIKILIAPLIESIILYDRLLYVLESKSDCDIVPAFDCKISPRNHILYATKLPIN
ncbi:methyltransferase-like protein 25B [Cylas formicarius]|uniref:methyltransferase-like protein 25B n=1 Tax=Cylas formicarius TaxID=197179 RepID=UPI002958771F|nr:methyltransferase-like protein 25B [Cylas formicarius]